MEATKGKEDKIYISEKENQLLGDVRFFILSSSVVKNVTHMDRLTLINFSSTLYN